MATKDPVKKTRVTKQQVNAQRVTTKKDGSPNWDGAAEWDGDTFTAHFRNAMNWYRLEKTSKDLKPKLVEWMGYAEYDKDTVNTVRKIKDKYFTGTMVNIAACLVKGMPEVHAGFNNGRDTAEWLRKEIEKVIASGRQWLKRG